MSVRAKFKVDSVKSVLGYVYNYETKTNSETEQRIVSLVPVYDSNPESENGKFFAATPSGRIELGVMNLDAAKLFEIGKEYYVDFTQVKS